MGAALLGIVTMMDSSLPPSSCIYCEKLGEFNDHICDKCKPDMLALIKMKIVAANPKNRSFAERLHFK